MKGTLLTLDDKRVDKTEETVRAEKDLEERIIREILLLKKFDPAKSENEEFESASLSDLRKYSGVESF